MIEDDQGPGEKAQKPRSSRYWLNQMDAALQGERAWRDQSEQVIKRYVDQRDGDPLLIRSDDTARVNILWSNTEVLKSVLFANLGKPDVARNFPKAGKDNKIARTAALILERALSSCNDRYAPEQEIEECVCDYLLSGRGQAWIELDATVEMQEGYDDEDAPGEAQLKRHETRFCHVNWNDWTHGPGKHWSDVPWVARKHLMDKPDVAEQFGDDLAEKIPQNYLLREGEKRTEETGRDDFRRALLWEIWDKRSKSRIYVAEGYAFEVERVKDPLHLEGFFPCPRPLLGVRKPGSLLPRPEFLQYQDQCAELDRVNTRILRLVESMKESGVYNASIDESDALKNLSMLEDGEFIPWKNWASLAQGGGLAGAFQSRDIAPYAQAIQVLAQRGLEILQTIYEVTGIADIVRGASDPRETYGAQRLKARFGTQRLQKRQKEVQRFVADLYRIKAEVIAEHFEPEQLSEMSGIDIPREEDKRKAQAILAMAQRQAMIAQQQQQLLAQQQVPQGQMAA